MLKKLLYLYNDGHNPFPTHGKGGLGYHLPQFRKRGKGLQWVGNDLIYVPDASTTPQRAAELTFDMFITSHQNRPQYPVPKTPKYDIDLIEDPYIDALNQAEIDRTKEIIELETLGFDVPHLYPEIPTDDQIEINEQNFINDIFEKAKLILDDLEPKVHSTQYTDVEKNTILKTMKTIAINYREELIDDEYDILYEARRLQYPTESITDTKKALVGKAFEEYLCKTGKAITRKMFNTLEGNTLNFDQYPSVPNGLKKFCVVDISTDTGIGEAKDYYSHDFTNASGTCNIQKTKLTGNPSFKIYFEKKGPDDYIVKYITCNNKAINDPTHILNKYNIIVNTKNGIWYHDLLKNKDFVNDNTMTKVDGQNFYRIIEDDLPNTMDRISGSQNPVPSIRIKNTDFKKIK